jgi:hypothetical protein
MVFYPFDEWDKVVYADKNVNFCKEKNWIGSIKNLKKGDIIWVLQPMM